MAWLQMLEMVRVEWIASLSELEASVRAKYPEQLEVRKDLSPVSRAMLTEGF